jgi:hypothetical protein
MRNLFGKYIKEDDGEYNFLDILCEFYTRLIFHAVDTDIDDEIPFEKIKYAIINGN